MQVLVLSGDAGRCAALEAALERKGFCVTCLGAPDLAPAVLREEHFDLVVMDERVDGRLTQTVALSAEKHNPLVSVVMLSDRPSEQTEELFELLPALYGILGVQTPVAMIAKMALAAVMNPEQAERRASTRKLWFTETPLVLKGPVIPPAAMQNAPARLSLHAS